MPRGGVFTSTNPASIASREKYWRRQKVCITPLGRFMAKVRVVESGCWEWMATRNQHGYGMVGVGYHKTEGAHRVAYRWLRGPIPEGLYLDHLCRNPPCVNPEHLEPVTRWENLLRGMDPERAANIRADRCGKGHPLTPDNVRWETDSRRLDPTFRSRKCRTCLAERERVRGKRRLRGGHPAHDPARRDDWIENIRAGRRVA